MAFDVTPERLIMKRGQQQIVTVTKTAKAPGSSASGDALRQARDARMMLDEKSGVMTVVGDKKDVEQVKDALKVVGNAGNAGNAGNVEVRLSGS